MDNERNWIRVLKIESGMAPYVTEISNNQELKPEMMFLTF